MRHCGLLAATRLAPTGTGLLGGPCCPHFTPRQRGKAPPHSGWPGPAASQACSWGGDITGGQAGPSLSWLGAPAPAPGHWHHQEPGLAALAWPLPPGLVPRGCAAAQRWALLHADIPGGLSQSQLPPGRRARRRSSQGPLLRNKTSPLRGGGCLQKPGDPQAPPDPSAGSDGGLCLPARLSTPATAPPPSARPGCVPGARSPPGLCAPPQLSPAQSPGDAASTDVPSGPTAGAAPAHLALLSGCLRWAGGCPWQAVPSCCLLAPPAAVSWWAPVGRKGGIRFPTAGPTRGPAPPLRPHRLTQVLSHPVRQQWKTVKVTRGLPGSSMLLLPATLHAFVIP